jgi:polysaccharide biosynthesis protein VpsM
MIKKVLFFILAVLFVLIGYCPAYCGTDAPVDKDRIDWDILGKRGGWLHGYLSLEEKYSDNIYYRDIDKQDDFITLIRPGIGITTPGGKVKPPKVYTSKNTPGGAQISQFDLPALRRFNGYLFYEPEFEIYSDHSDLNAINQAFQGALQYNLRGGLSVKLFDRFIDTDDPYSGSLTFLEEKDQYRMNLAGITLGYRISDKLKVDLDYSNFLVDYDEQRNEGLNRTDHTATGYIYFQFRPKLAALTGYEFTKVDYDTRTSSDNTENRFYGGLQWDITGKSRGRIKVGYSVKDYENSDIENSDNYIYEFQLDHRFTPKTSLNLTAYRKQEESDYYQFDDRLTHRITASYLQKVTGKISIGLELWYSYESYEGEVNIGGESIKRTDDLYYLNPYVRYYFRDWFSMNVEYTLEKRDSTITLYDFSTNSVLIGLTLEK